MTKQYVVGNAGAPIAESKSFESEDLVDILIDYIVLNNENYNQLSPSPDFTHSYKEGKICMTTLTFALGDKLIIVYKKCNC
jgi:hypothetical protein